MLQTIRIRKLLPWLALAAGLASPPAFADTPGLADKVYPAVIEPGVTELETRYGRLTGGAEDGADGLTLELAHGFSRRFYGAVLAGLDRDFGEHRRVRQIGVEGVWNLGRPGGVDVALYGEYEQGIREADGGEFKLLLQRRHGRFDGRLNLIAEKAFDGEPVQLGYAASADYAIAGDELKIGAEAFGGAGTFTRFAAPEQHFLGPVVKTEIEHLPARSQLELQAGYLFALPGPARDRSDGQVRVQLEWEAHF